MASARILHCSSYEDPGELCNRLSGLLRNRISHPIYDDVHGLHVLCIELILASVLSRKLFDEFV